MRYTISEMASLLGVTTHTLRYYEKMGLIRPEVNEETGYRYYTVTDTRRFNLCRELRAAELSLEECRELIGSPSVEQSDKMFARQAARLRRRQVLDELSIHFLEKMQEQYRTLEQDVGRVWVQNFPEMWRLTFSQEEEASRDRELQQCKRHTHNMGECGGIVFMLRHLLHYREIQAERRCFHDCSRRGVEQRRDTHSGRP